MIAGDCGERAEPSQAEPSRAMPSRAEPSRAEPSRAEPSRAEPSRAEPSRAEPSRAVSQDDGENAAAVRGSKLRQQNRRDWSGGLGGRPWDGVKSRQSTDFECGRHTRDEFVTAGAISCTPVDRGNNRRRQCSVIANDWRGAKAAAKRDINS
jgi:hypothetical protein